MPGTGADADRRWPKGSLRYFGDWSDWLAFWPIVGLAVGFGARRWLGRPPMFLVAAVLLILGMYGATYVVSPWQLADLMEFTSNRLLLHVTPLCVFLLAEIFCPELAGAASPDP